MADKKKNKLKMKKRPSIRTKKPVTALSVRFRNDCLQFNDQKKQDFLELFQQTGRLHLSAEVVGVSGSTVRNHLKSDREFAEAFEAAKAIYGEKLEQEVERRGVHGWDEPVINFKTGMVIGKIRKFSDRMLELLLKKNVAEYRDKSSLDVNVAGGVLVVGARAEDAKDWQMKYAQLEKPKH